MNLTSKSHRQTLCPLHLCVLKSVAPGVLDILRGFVIALGINIDGAGSSGSQKLLPNLLYTRRHLFNRPLLQLLHRQPEPEGEKERSKNKFFPKQGVNSRHTLNFISNVVRWWFFQQNWDFFFFAFTWVKELFWKNYVFFLTIRLILSNLSGNPAHNMHYL